jgi:hypothetical protein
LTYFDSNLLIVSRGFWAKIGIFTQIRCLGVQRHLRKTKGQESVPSKNRPSATILVFQKPGRVTAGTDL